MFRRRHFAPLALSSSRFGFLCLASQSRIRGRRAIKKSNAGSAGRRNVKLCLIVWDRAGQLKNRGQRQSIGHRRRFPATQLDSSSSFSPRPWSRAIGLTNSGCLFCANPCSEPGRRLGQRKGTVVNNLQCAVCRRAPGFLRDILLEACGLGSNRARIQLESTRPLDYQHSSITGMDRSLDSSCGRYPAVRATARRLVGVS